MQLRDVSVFSQYRADYDYHGIKVAEIQTWHSRQGGYPLNLPKTISPTEIFLSASPLDAAAPPPAFLLAPAPPFEGLARAVATFLVGAEEEAGALAEDEAGPRVRDDGAFDSGCCCCSCCCSGAAGSSALVSAAAGAGESGGGEGGRAAGVSSVDIVLGS